MQHDGPVMVVAFANAPAYGDGIRIAPRALLDDGLLDICVVGKMEKRVCCDYFLPFFPAGT